MTILLKYLNAGVKNAPAFLFLLYYFFVSTDLLTTYIASPDLKYEGNWMVRRFNLGWSEIIFLAVTGALFLSLVFVISLQYVKSFFTLNSSEKNISILNEIFKNKLLLICFLIFGYFYKHFFYSIFVTVNNYLSYIYLHNVENFLTGLAHDYISMEQRIHPYYFLLTKVLFFVLAYIYAGFIFYKIRNKSLRLNQLS